MNARTVIFAPKYTGNFFNLPNIYFCTDFESILMNILSQFRQASNGVLTHISLLFDLKVFVGNE